MSEPRFIFASHYAIVDTLFGIRYSVIPGDDDLYITKESEKAQWVLGNAARSVWYCIHQQASRDNGLSDNPSMADVETVIRKR